ncbi:MAG TPA: glucose-1-phosphate thymidylyltransferase [Crocinitomix sp.]|nr:glucose-1-phosphate thymidylyltransferase [Crocinitomix sp.]
MKIVLSDNNLHKNFRPITLTRPVAEIRFGILTIKETWTRHFLNCLVEPVFFYETENYLECKYPYENFYDIKVAGNVKPTLDLVRQILALEKNQSLYVNFKWVATKGNKEISKKNIELTDFIYIEHIWELFQKNDKAISLDYRILTKDKITQPISTTNTVINPINIFIEEGAKVECAILNASSGPIYIGKNAEVMEGCMIRGSFALLENATLKMGAKIYGATTIGAYCKVGGEVSNSIFQSYSNKGHDGFLGNSIVGEWCNFGADTNSSNLKNNYGKLKIYDYNFGELKQTNIMFCGVLMGDHSKTGINTMLNTATTVGVSANIFGGGFPPKYIPSFSWGGSEQSPKFILEKAFEVSENMMKRRKVSLSVKDKKILTYIFENNL